jgi:hypothetical protein
MTVKTATGQAGATTGGLAGRGPMGQARQSSPRDRTLTYWTWVSVVNEILGNRRIQEKVITGAVVVYLLAIVIKNNKARPVRRAVASSMRLGDSREIEKLHRAPQAPEPSKR